MSFATRSAQRAEQQRPAAPPCHCIGESLPTVANILSGAYSRRVPAASATRTGALAADVLPKPVRHASSAVARAGPSPGHRNGGISLTAVAWQSLSAARFAGVPSPGQRAELARLATDAALAPPNIRDPRVCEVLRRAQAALAGHLAAELTPAPCHAAAIFVSGVDPTAFPPAQLAELRLAADAVRTAFSCRRAAREVLSHRGGGKGEAGVTIARQRGGLLALAVLKPFVG